LELSAKTGLDYLENHRAADNLKPGYLKKEIMFSQTSEYAIRALIEIATRPEGEQVLSAQLGESLGIPQHYLSKILQQLVRTRVLKSVRGRSGGFSLARSAGSIKLRDIIEPFEDLRKYEDCILGQPVCNEAGACPLHDFWKDVRERYLDELKTKSLKDLTDYQLKKLNTMNAGLFRRVGAVPGKQSLRKRKAAGN
jgi:Rrf2 family transcriptional regulator, iron-sulfur cluster assembly transcription factor